MKIHRNLFRHLRRSQALVACLALATSAAAATAPPPSTGDAISQTNPVPFTVVARNGHSRVWQRVTWHTNQDRAFAVTNKFTELATGMHFRRNGQGDWLETSEQIDLLPPGADFGAAATNGPHQVFFPADIYEGAIRTVSPDGKQLTSRPAAITYFDGTNNVAISCLTNSVGQILPSGNQVIYTNCFPGLADILCTYRKSGFQCDLVFRSKPPPPADPDHCRIQLWTEWFDTEDPVPTSPDTNQLDGLSDSTLDFGVVKMIRGKAFSVGRSQLGSDVPAAATRSGPPVYKTWQKVNGRAFLIEEIPLRRLASQLNELAFLEQPHNKARRARVAGASPDLPAGRPIQRSRKQILLAKADLSRRRGVAMDYTELVGASDFYRFEANTTYWVSDYFYVYDLATIEGNTVVKFPENGSGYIVPNEIAYETGPYRMAVLTSENDDSAGEVLDWSSASPAQGSAIYLATSGSAPPKYLRFCYAGTGIEYYNADPEIWHCQFLSCALGLQVDFENVVSLHNVLFSSCGQPVYGDAITHGEHLTVHDCHDGFNNGDAYLTNCLFTELTGSLHSPGTNNSTVLVLPSSSGVYQTVGGASFYLADQSPYRNVGTTAINTNLLADVRRKTTSPPLVYSNATIELDTTFYPVAQRDTDQPDIGYHYDVLDYCFGGCQANANLTFAPGTAVGWFFPDDTSYGIHLADAKILTFSGKAESPDYWVQFRAVQEGNGNWQYPWGRAGITGSAWPNIADSPQINAQFTRFSMPASAYSHYADDDGWIVANLTSCELYSAGAAYWNGGHHYTNCLFDRFQIGLTTDHNPSSCFLFNCTMRGGSLIISRSNDGTNAPVRIRGTTFDGTELTTSGAGVGVTYYDYNAFLTNADRTTPNGAHDQIVTDFDWRTGPLGNWYLPTNSPLINTGGVTADLISLYHFTTITNLVSGHQIKETNSVVDIGFHYVALNSSGLPFDTDSDGLPDYWEDSNGNEVATDDPTSWTSYNSPNGLVSGSALQVFTPLK